MRKEVLYAVIFGIILGGIILFGINLANKTVSTLNSDSKESASESTPTPAISKKAFEIITPQNHEVFSEKVISISGKSDPNLTLAIVTEMDDLIITSSPEGTFSAQINLVAGENTLTFTGLLKDNLTESQTITVIQSSSLPE